MNFVEFFFNFDFFKITKIEIWRMKKNQIDITITHQGYKEASSSRVCLLELSGGL